MNKVLNIVNGEAIIKKLKLAEISGIFLPWQDFLHEGPVPENLSLEALSKIRAQYISTKGLGSFDEVHQSFKDRNATLNSFKKYQKIILWFENDLYDQLQFIQILDWFFKYADNSTPIYYISCERHLYSYTRKELDELLLYNKELVSHTLYIIAKKAWSAFSAPTPEAWFRLQDDDISELPFLKYSIIRMLEEYPNTINGLSRTAHQALLIIEGGVHHPQEIFEQYQESEQLKFMGDILFWNILKELVNKNLLNAREEGRELKITSLGKEVIKGDINWLDINQIDKWLGGVHLNQQNLWCWDIKSQKIINSLS
jgi:hypothetical protein